MEWCKEILEQVKFENISNEDEKKKIAQRIAQKVKDGEVIGFGSGSTSYEIKMLCTELEIPTTTIMEHKPDWCFDGADEVDANNWLIKGRGAAMFKEKLNIANSKITYILVDKSKMVKELDTNFHIPVECYPLALNSVKEKLIELGAIEIKLRQALKKDGPVITENNNLILDVRFTEIYETLEKDIKDITGVIESGLFTNSYNIEIIN